MFPTLSDGLTLGEGATLPTGALKAAAGANTPPDDTILVRFHPGTDLAAARSRLQRSFGTQTSINVLAPEQPVDLVNFGRVANLPYIVGGLVGLLAVATLVHLLVTSIRRRRRDLAVLKTLGFTPAQMRQAVAWQATTIATVAFVLGLPIGTIIGRWIWLAFARQLGVLAAPAVPAISWIGLILATLVVANLVAVFPARSAARTSASLILRTP